MKQEAIKDLGTITFIKRKNTRRINVRIEAQGQIKVSLPYSIAYNTAKSFILENKSYIQERLAHLNARLTVFDTNTSFHTMWHTLVMQANGCKQPEYTIDNHQIKVNYPKNLPANDATVQQTARLAIEHTLKKEAKIYLPRRTKELALKYHFNYNKVFVKNIKTLWGSCSYKNNINLNIHLMRLPRHLIDHIILHELVHTVFKNHGPQFQQLLRSISEYDPQVLKVELKKYTPQMY